MISLQDRFAGCLCGLMIGDALGAHVEGQPPNYISRIYPAAANILSNPPPAPWYYTDDTQMAIGVAESLVRDRQIVESTLCECFVANYEPHRGYGRGARRVLGAMEDQEDYRALAERVFPGGSYGNGAAMRVAPVGLVFHQNLDELAEQAERSARPTHTHPLGIEGAQLLALAVGTVVASGDKFESPHVFDLLLERCRNAEFRDRITCATHLKDEQELSQLGNGIAALDSVVTAISCFLFSPDSYEQVVARAIYLGGDTDTIAAMAGALAGAHIGIEGISQRLLDSVEDEIKGRSYVLQLAKQLSEIVG